METLLLFLAFSVWSIGCFAAGIAFAACRSVDKFIKLFDREKLAAAYIGDENDIKNRLKEL